MCPSAAAKPETASGYAAFHADEPAAISNYAAPVDLPVPQPKIVKTISPSAVSNYSAFDSSQRAADGAYAAFKDDDPKDSVYRNFVVETDQRMQVRTKAFFFFLAKSLLTVICAIQVPAVRGTDIHYSVAVDDAESATSVPTAGSSANGAQAAQADPYAALIASLHASLTSQLSCSSLYSELGYH